MKQRKRKKNVVKAFEKYGKVFIDILEPILENVENFNPDEHRTFQHEFSKSIEKRFENVTNDKEVFEHFIKLMESVDFNSAAKEQNKKLKKELNEYEQKDKRFKQLYNLVYDAEKKCPNIGAFIFFMSNPIELFAKSNEPLDLISESDSLTGEKAGKNAIRVYREVAEYVYIDYLKAVFRFVQILEGKTEIKVPIEFGNLCKQISDKLKKYRLENLVEPEAAWIRNATCHADAPYNASIQKLVLGDRTKQIKKEFTPGEIMGKAMQLHSMVVDNYLNLVSYYFRKKAFNDWKEILSYTKKNMLAIINEDPKKIKVLQEMMQKDFSEIEKFSFKN